jgi:hypothetical protein
MIILWNLKKNPSQKRAGGVAQGEGPEFNPLLGKKKKTRKGANAHGSRL